MIESFDDMGLKEDLLRGIYSYGFEKPSAIQQRAIKPLILMRDTIAQAQSGTGKTATFTIGARLCLARARGYAARSRAQQFSSWRVWLARAAVPTPPACCSAGGGGAKAAGGDAEHGVATQRSLLAPSTATRQPLVGRRLETRLPSRRAGHRWHRCRRAGLGTAGTDAASRLRCFLVAAESLSFPQPLR